MRIALAHLDSAVAEYALQPEDVSALHHVMAGERMAAMWVIWPGVFKPVRRGGSVH